MNRQPIDVYMANQVIIAMQSSAPPKVLESYIGHMMQAMLAEARKRGIRA
jgi:hypothetical protein